jgi:hypothetical protein
MRIINPDRKIWVWLRAVIFLAIALFAYIMSVYYIFSQHNILTFILFVLIFFLFWHFAYLHFLWTKPRYIAYLMLFLIWINIIVFWYQSIFMVLCNVSLHVAIFMFIWYIDWSSNNVVVFDSWSYFTSWGYMFTVFVTISRSFALLGLYQKFPFTCQQLSDTSSRVIDFAAYPLKMSFNQANKLKAETKKLFSMKMWDVLLDSQLISIPTFPDKKEQWKFIDKMLAYKQKYLDQTMKENDSVNMGICDYLLDRVESVYQNTTVQISIIVTLFLLLYWFIRITFWVMTIIWFIIFKLLCLFKVYTFAKVVVEVDKIV